MSRTIVAKLIEPGDLEERRPASEFPLQRRLWARVAFALSGGGRWCLDCDQATERIESDHGQPARSTRCGSYRLKPVQGNPKL